MASLFPHLFFPLGDLLLLSLILFKTVKNVYNSFLFYLLITSVMYLFIHPEDDGNANPSTLTGFLHDQGPEETFCVATNTKIKQKIQIFVCFSLNNSLKIP